MGKKMLNPADVAAEVVKALPKGILLTTKNGSKVNSMVIGWGTIGVIWGKPVFVTYVRTGRFSMEQLDANPEFTVNIPVKDFEQKKRILAVCGAKSGRDIDKVEEAGLTLIAPKSVNVPAVREFPLTLECKVVYRQTQEVGLYSDELMRFYPQNVDSSATGGNKDPHVMLFGEITACYLVEDHDEDGEDF